MIIIIISREKDGSIIKFYQIYRLELDRSRLEIKTGNKEVVCYKVKIIQRRVHE